MFARDCVSILIMLLSTGFSAYALNASNIKSQTYTTKTKNLGSFTQVAVQGRINVSLHTGYRKPQIIVKGNPRDLEQLKTVVAEDTLHLILGLGYPAFGEVTVEVRGGSLNSFNYEGMGIIKGDKICTNGLDLRIKNTGTTSLAGSIGIRDLNIAGDGNVNIRGIHSRYMNLLVEGNSQVQLSGVVNIANLNFEGDGRVNLRWIRSDELKIRAKQSAQIELAGNVNRLNVELWDHAHFKGRYLRAQRSFVKTYDRALAEIQSVCHQSTLASGVSDIYYYNLPETRADFMAYNGAVLDMRDWNDPFIEDFTTYNKQFP